MKVRSDLCSSLSPARFLTLTLWFYLTILGGGWVFGQAALRRPGFAGNTTPMPDSGTLRPAARPADSPPTPVITSVTPNSIIAGSPDTAITVAGTGFTSDSIVEWNGAALSTSLTYNNSLFATVPAADLTTAGSGSVTVDTPGASPELSNAVTVSITNPPAPTLTSIYPSAGPLNTGADVTLNGSGFTSETTVAANGVTVPSEFVSSGQLTATIPAATLALPGNVNITVSTPAPGGGTSAAVTYTTFLDIANNDIVYNAADGLLYASVMVSGSGSGGNTVVGIDPATGTTKRTIWVGSNPDKLALSTDGTQLFVGLDGAAAVAQVDLPRGEVIRRFSLGGGPGVYNPPFTAKALAALPGKPDSVAVASTGDIAIYDSGVARARKASVASTGLSFGPSASVLYSTTGGQIQKLTVGPTGITATKTLASPSYGANSIQYDGGRLYLSSGQVLNASTGALLGTFYASGNTQANGPVVSDPALKKAFIGITSFSSNGQVSAFNESTFTLSGSIPVNGIGEQGYPTNFQKIVRWGPDGLALSAAFSAFSSINQIFIFQSNLVKNLSSSPADLSVSLAAPASSTTGSPTSWVATVTNHGPNEAQGATLVIRLDPSLAIGKIATSGGTCKSGTEFVCDLGNLANGVSATVSVNGTPTTQGTLAGVANISSISYDPQATNNQSTTSTAVTGSLFNPAPSIAAISPNFVQAGSEDFTLTVTGRGFTAESVVMLGSEELDTSLESSTQLTATVSASDVATYGWAAVTVSNPEPGGGVSKIVPLTIYGVVHVPANGIVFDPYSRMLWASVPSAAKRIAGNSVVSIDPMTGAVGKPVFVGSQPTVMAESLNGKYLYVGLSGANRLAQFDLEQKKLLATIPLTLKQGGSTSTITPSWLAVMPGSDTTLAVNQEGEGGTFGIFDIKGKTGKFRPNMSGTYDGVNPVFANASRIYAYDSETTGAEFYRYDVDEDGVKVIDGTTLDGMGGFGGTIDLGSDGLVYGIGGGIINPSTTPPSQIATLPGIDFYHSGDDGAGAATAADPSLRKEFLMLTNTAGTWAYGLVRYNLNTYVPEAVVDMPQAANNVEAQWTIFRFGQDGLALLSAGENFATDQHQSVLLLVRGPFVAPQLLMKDSAARLTSSSKAAISQGSGNTILRLTGSNFLPGVAVTWNGSYRTTTILDAKHVKIDVPASDLAKTGTAKVVATNPGAPPSNALRITIGP